MYVSHIGKRFVTIYNEKNKTNLTAKQFFDTVLFPCFYDNERYLQSAANTTLFQLIAQKKTKDPVARLQGKKDLEAKIEKYAKGESDPEMSFAIGYASADVMGTTSGQVTNMKLPLDEEDMYASWIGAGFGMGLQGGLSILIDNETVLQAIFEGWAIYRKFVDETDNIDNKIESWNNVWIAHRFSEDYNPRHPGAFNPFTGSKTGGAEIKRTSWVKTMFALALKMPNLTVNAYVYSLGQMNKTIGFVQIRLPDFSMMWELCSSLFKNESGLAVSKLSDIYETEFVFSTACERYSLIGLEAIRPKDLKKFMPGYADKSLPKLKSDKDSITSYYIYQLWIIAMLNNKELLELAGKTAHSLKEFAGGGERGKKDRTNAIESLLGSRNRKEFIDNINKILEIDKSVKDICSELVNTIMLDIAPDNIPLFITLLRFKYLSNNIQD